MRPLSTRRCTVKQQRMLKVQAWPLKLHVQGAVKPHAVADMSRHLCNMGCYEVSLGDTIGVGTPASVTSLIQVRPSHDLASALPDRAALAQAACLPWRNWPPWGSAAALLDCAPLLATGLIRAPPSGNRAATSCRGDSTSHGVRAGVVSYQHGRPDTLSSSPVRGCGVPRSMGSHEAELSCACKRPARRPCPWPS